MIKRSDGILPQPLSGKEYAAISLIFVVLGIILLAGFVYFAPRLLSSGTRDDSYYVILLIFGLICALVLFGVLKSYAQLKVRQPGVLLELGGPVVVAFLVVYGGFRLVPRPKSFNVVIRAHAPGKPIIRTGSIRLEYGSNPPEQPIESNGDAEFREIPQEYKGQSVKVLPEVDGYEQQYYTVTLDKQVIDVTLVKEHPETRLTGKIVPPQPHRTVRIVVDDEEPVEPTEDGRFAMVVHRKLNERVRISISVDGQERYDDFQTLPGPVTLVLRKPST
jgi:predicted membrane protein